jgi:transcriptional regulator with XRE-family HTH domain
VGNVTTTGDRIRRARIARSLTQEALARLVDVTVGQVSKWERAVDEPSLDSLRILRRVLGVSWDELIGEPK